MPPSALQQCLENHPRKSCVQPSPQPLKDAPQLQKEPFHLTSASPRALHARRVVCRGLPLESLLILIRLAVTNANEERHFEKNLAVQRLKTWESFQGVAPRFYRF